MGTVRKSKNFLAFTMERRIALGKRLELEHGI